MSSTENNQVFFSSFQTAHLAIVKEADGDLGHGEWYPRMDRDDRVVGEGEAKVGVGK
jgi:hypothetical protein